MTELDTHGRFAHAEVPDRLIAIRVTRIGARAETSPRHCVRRAAGQWVTVSTRNEARNED